MLSLHPHNLQREHVPDLWILIFFGLTCLTLELCMDPTLNLRTFALALIFREELDLVWTFSQRVEMNEV